MYAVTTTGVYCKPSCGARAPLEKNVVYFSDGAAAQGAGFRPCKRCRPDTPEERRDRMVLAARRLLDRAERAPTLEQLAGELGVSKYHLQRLFKGSTGMTPLEYAKALRLSRAREHLLRGTPVTEAMYAAGYSGSARFHADSQALGLPPSSLRRAGRGETLHYAVKACRLGRVLVATSARGVCWVAMGDDSAALYRELSSHFHQATLLDDDESAQRFAQRIARWIDTGEVADDIPLDLMGTRFQIKVWQELCRTRRGETTNYGELAERLGQPGAARAVGTACGQNPVAVLVPCHRVLRKDGQLGGYRWGLARKRALLEREGRGKPRG